MKFDERTYEEWFEKYLGDVENIDRMEDPSPLRHQPRTFKFWIWIILLSISIVICGIVSFIIYDVYEWLSNLMLNFSAGLFASLILLCFTTSKDKNINYANDVLPILRNRLSNMREALNYSFAPLQIAIQQQSCEDFHDYTRLLTNTQCVISNFIQYLTKVCRYKPKYLIECANKKEDFFNDCKSLSDLSYKLYTDKDTSMFIEARDLVHKVDWQATYMLGILDRYIDDITFRHYNIKYNKRIKQINDTDWEKIIRGKK